MKKIEKLRDVWPNEASDFIPWLAEEDNIKILSDIIGLEIEVNGTESQVGYFRADIEGIDAVTHEYVAAIEHSRSFVLYSGVGKIEHLRR